MIEPSAWVVLLFTAIGFAGTQSIFLAYRNGSGALFLFGTILAVIFGGTACTLFLIKLSFMS